MALVLATGMTMSLAACGDKDSTAGTDGADGTGNGAAATEAGGGPLEEERKAFRPSIRSR